MLGGTPRLWYTPPDTRRGEVCSPSSTTRETRRRSCAWQRNGEPASVDSDVSQRSGWFIFDQPFNWEGFYECLTRGAINLLVWFEFHAFYDKWFPHRIVDLMRSHEGLYIWKVRWRAQSFWPEIRAVVMQKPLQILDRLVAMRAKSDKEAKMNLDQLKAGSEPRWCVLVALR